ncbi:ABC-type dipeptide/oligopeptide/nickel transport system ATPase subunit [Aminobacter aminovorans]|uniref:Glutathione import ATP-binding protein GsiA n=1 Tax=Aminobacter aminovorans TaxID=83263 RepID=A0A381IL46_AMIAI|nr:ABC transporter ATP-binding protein [Aminobacter aminovorans]TCS24953.1 ABC-type dipeptide/oligopeptide/nickel transport system ATPase subunit [Aminobacter aminovorans]SUY28645.1 Glutathione import ATP-binding protein GsiA [Aminobacter aminovorans]
MTMLSVERLSKRYKDNEVLTNVSFEVGQAAIVGLVGQSGSGKSTIAKCILGLERPDSGRVRWHGQPLVDGMARRKARRGIQGVFQDPRSSLNPRWTIRRILTEPLVNWLPKEGAAARSERLRHLLERVALSDDLLDRHPHELSTGQCQRVCMARALAPEPELLVLDEPLSALDVSVQAKLIDLLLDLHRTSGIGYLLVTHDFGVVADICQKIIVLDRGQIVEHGNVDTVLSSPSHPYTQALLRDVLPMPEWNFVCDTPPGVASQELPAFPSVPAGRLIS